MGRKRTWAELDSRTGIDGMAQTVAVLREAAAAQTASNDRSESTQSPTRKRRREKHEKGRSHPAICHSAHTRLHTHVKISDLQALVLYILADGTAPQWVAVRHHHAVSKVVVLMVPGLEQSMFDGRFDFNQRADDKSRDGLKVDGKRKPDPDDYYPSTMDEESLPLPVKPLARVFSRVWPVRTPGDDRFSQVESPAQVMLASPVPKKQGAKKQAADGGDDGAVNGAAVVQTPATAFMATVPELLDNEYVLHWAQLEERTTAAGESVIKSEEMVEDWVYSHVNRDQVAAMHAQSANPDTTPAYQLLALDCEMCKTDGGQLELTRISIVAEDGSVVLDELVKPDRPITDYLTP